MTAEYDIVYFHCREEKRFVCDASSGPIQVEERGLNFSSVNIYSRGNDDKYYPCFEVIGYTLKIFLPI